ncbi:MAG: CHASE2 domain-containing protein [Candidatus Omnitrophota bacterium]
MSQDPAGGFSKIAEGFFQRMKPRAARLGDILHYPRILGSVFFALIVTVHAFWIAPEPSDRFENAFFDLFMRLRPPIAAAGDIAVLEIADSSFAKLGPWPWPRKVYAELVRLLTEWEVKAILFEKVFNEKTDPLQDEALRAALEEARKNSVRLYLPSAFEGHLENHHWILPLPEYEKLSNATGPAHFAPDGDGVLRRVRRVWSDPNRTALHFGLAAALDLYWAVYGTDFQAKIPVDERGNLLLNWAGKGFETFERWPVEEVLRSGKGTDRGQIPPVTPEDLRGKICVIGVTAGTHAEMVRTPFEPSAPAVMAYPNLISNVFRGNFLRVIGAGGYAALIFGIGLLLFSMLVPFRNVLSTSVTAGTMLFWVLLAFWVFCAQGVWIPVFQPLMMILTLFGYAVVYSHFFLNRERTDLFKLSTRDGLTGLFIIRHFRILLNHAVTRAQQKGGAVAVILFDLDDFKLVNDNYGHQVGDLMLMEIAQVLKYVVGKYGRRKKDAPLCTAARYGGEEFMVMVENFTRVSDVMRIAEGIRNAIQSLSIKCKDCTTGVTASFGVSFLGKGETIPDAMVRRADEALYRSKSQGKNRVSLQEPPA